MYNYQYLLQYYNQLPLVLKWVWVFILILLVLLIVLVVYLIILRSKLRREEKLGAKYKKGYEKLLIDYIENDIPGEDLSAEQKKIINKFKIYVRDSFKRDVLVSVMLNLKNAISGDVAQIIYELYHETKLVNYALVKLDSGKWHIIAKGIRELTQFEIIAAKDKVNYHRNHNRREVRIEVQLFMVKLFHFKGLDFLNDLEWSLSEWDQIQLLEVLHRLENQQLPNITPWLRSKNNSVVIFALKLLKFYSQYEGKTELLELLNHKDENIRLKTIELLKEFDFKEAKDNLKNNFDDRSTEDQIAFLKTLESNYKKEDEPFLLEQAKNENFKIKFSALKILKNLNINKLATLKKSSTDSEYVKMVNFIENN